MRGRRDARRLAVRKMVDARDVAVRDEPAQLALETIDKVEGRLRALRGVAGVGMQDVHLEHRGHRLVREAPHVVQIVRRFEAEAA